MGSAPRSAPALPWSHASAGSEPLGRCSHALPQWQQWGVLGLGMAWSWSLLDLEEVGLVSAS